MFSVNGAAPMLVLMPLFETFTLTPGSSLKLLRKRQAIGCVF